MFSNFPEKKDTALGISKALFLLKAENNPIRSWFNSIQKYNQDVLLLLKTYCKSAVNVVKKFTVSCKWFC